MKTTASKVFQKYLLCLPLMVLMLACPLNHIKGQTVAINEVMASNGETLADMDGGFEDWVEFYNYGTEPVNLEGYGLSDDFNNPFRWIFPQVNIAPGEYLLVWASGKDRRDETELHANFSIDREGEEILLTRPDSARVDEIPPTEIPRDISYGRYPNGTGEWFWYTDPTPGAPNHGEVVEELPAVPSPPGFSREGGPFTSDFMLGFVFDAGLEVWYTTDGSEPAPGRSLRYGQPFNISRTTVVRAIAHEPGGLTSEVVNGLFTRLSHSSSQFSSNLPLMVIHKFNQTIPDGPRVPVYMSLFDKGEDGRVRLADAPVLQSRMEINLRGSSSLSFPKNMYGFQLIEEDGSNNKQPLLGMPEEHNWILNGPYSDKSLMRNVIAYGLSNDIGRYSPRTRFIELYLHDGTGPLEDAHYHGVYVLTERIKWSDGRVEIEKISQDDNNEPDITGGYIFKRDRLNPGQSGFRTNRGSHFAFVRPQEEDITQQQKNWLTNYVSEFETALFDANFADPESGYAKYIDTWSFIDAHLVTELLKEIDGYRLSTFFHKDRGGKIVKGPLWDFNISMGNVDYYPDPYYTDNAYPEPWKPQGWYYSLLSQHIYLYGWFTRLFEDPEFRAMYAERYWQLRRGQFSDDSLKARINNNAFILSEAQDRNFKRWPVLNRYVWPNQYIAPTYNHEIQWIRDWLMSRTRWTDKQFGKRTRLIHFWHFNDLPDEGFSAVPADSTVNNGGLTYEGSGDGYTDRVNDGTLLNADLGMPAAGALRVRNPSADRELVLTLPTTDYMDVVVRYAVKRTTNGARKQTVYYRTTDAGSWMIYGDTLEITEDYQQFRFNFAGIDETDDNPHFSIRILFHGDEAAGFSGNNRFDNITVDGYSIFDDEEEDEDLESKARAWYYNSQLNVNNPFESTADIEIFNLSGHLVGRFTAEGRGIHSFALRPPGGIYIIRLRNEHHVLSNKFFVHY